MTAAALRALRDAPPPEGDALADARIEDLEFLASHGVGLTEAANRLGLLPKSLEKWLTDRGHNALAAQLRTHDPIPNPTYCQKGTRR